MSVRTDILTRGAKRSLFVRLIDRNVSLPVHRHDDISRDTVAKMVTKIALRLENIVTIKIKTYSLN